jgi:hypothetical protein
LSRIEVEEVEGTIIISSAWQFAVGEKRRAQSTGGKEDFSENLIILIPIGSLERGAGLSLVWVRLLWVRLGHSLSAVGPTS